ncbi:MAG TPA: DoxX family protein, partial [Pseudonocardiaceae bacterium]|nr:DoxX family protein [Pseudonocardiaceae bacterium]
MNIVLWIIAGLLAVAFAGAGLMKLTQPKEKLAASGMGWTEQFSPGAIKAIGALEVLAAIGL